MKTTNRLILALSLFAFGGGLADERPPKAPDDYPALDSWFGYSRSEPIYDGWLFVEGQYIDAPYVVEQRGRHIYVNGHLVATTVDDWWLFLTKYDYPLHEEPPDPVIPADWPFDSVRRHPDVLRWYQYYCTLNKTYDEWLKRYLDILKASPGGKDIVKIDEDRWGMIRYRVTEANGRSYTFHTQGGSKPMGLRKLDPDWPRYMRQILDSWISVRGGMGESVWIMVVEDGRWNTGRGFHLLKGPGRTPQTDVKWAALFAVLASERPLEDKARALHRLGFLDRETVEHARSNWGSMLDRFKPTEQLQLRLAGDERWRALAPKPAGPFGVLLKEPTFGGQGLPRPPPPPEAAAAAKPGDRKSEPIWSGFVFVDGWYIDAPYIVERRGGEVRLNGYPAWRAEAPAADDPHAARRAALALDREFEILQEHLTKNAVVVIEENAVQLARRLERRLGMGMDPHERLWSTLHLDVKRICEEDPYALSALGLIGEDEDQKAWERRMSRFLFTPRFSPQFWRRTANDPNWKTPARVE